MNVETLKKRMVYCCFFYETKFEERLFDNLIKYYKNRFNANFDIKEFLKDYWLINGLKLHNDFDEYYYNVKNKSITQCVLSMVRNFFDYHESGSLKEISDHCHCSLEEMERYLVIFRMNGIIRYCAISGHYVLDNDDELFVCRSSRNKDWEEYGKIDLNKEETIAPLPPCFTID